MYFNVIYFSTIYIVLVFVPVCPEGYIQCPGDVTCINSTLFCDGNYDCPNYADESETICG